MSAGALGGDEGSRPHGEGTCGWPPLPHTVPGRLRVGQCPPLQTPGGLVSGYGGGTSAELEYRGSPASNSAGDQGIQWWSEEFCGGVVFRRP
jgi:hypothetical protein